MYFLFALTWSVGISVDEDGRTAVPNVATTTLLSATKEGLDAYDKHDDGVVNYKDFEGGDKAASEEENKEDNAQEAEGAEEVKNGDDNLAPAASNASDGRSTISPLAAIGGGAPLSSFSPRRFSLLAIPPVHRKMHAATLRPLTLH